jgi:predicted transcriptional regulator
MKDSFIIIELPNNGRGRFEDRKVHQIRIPEKNKNNALVSLEAFRTNNKKGDTVFVGPTPLEA